MYIVSSLTNVGHGAFYGCPLTAVYFNGTSDEWNVYIDNSAVSNGNFTTEIVYYYSKEKPTVEGKFWHYVNNVPTVWEVNIQPVDKYTITFDMHGYGNAPEDITEATALPAELPTVADDGDWTFAGWYLDGEYETAATAGATITTNTTLHAKWESKIFTHGNGAVTGLTDYGKTLSAITIPSVIAGEQITKISYAAFNFCDNLVNVVIPNSVKSIGEAAFSYCTGLTSIEIPNSVTSIGAQAFSYCGNLTSIEIPNSVTSIGYNAFANCTELSSVTIPNSVTSLQASTFRDCTSLEIITIPSSVASLGNYTFMDCTGLISVIIPSGLTSIGYGTFDDCTSLTTVYYGGADSAAWDNIEIDGFNVPLTTATRYYYSVNPPETEGKFWHYVNNVPTVWVSNVFITYYNGDEVEYIPYTLGEGESGIEKRVLQGDADEKFVGWFEAGAEEEFDYSSVTKGNNYTLYAKWHDLITIDGETYEVECIDGSPLWQYETIDEYDSLDLWDLSLNTTDGDRIELEEIRDRLTIVVDDGFYNYVFGEYEVSITYGKHTKYNYTIDVEYSHE